MSPHHETAVRTKTSARRHRRRLRLEFMEDRLTPSVSATFQVASDWGAGFVASIKINNDQPIPILNWRLEFDFPYQITEIWNGRIGSHVGNHYAIDNAGYNSTIFPNSTTEFGFLGTPGHVTTEPANYILNGTPLNGQPAPTVSIGNATVTEGDTTNVTALLPVTLSAASGGPITVKYATRNGTAITGSDYVTASGTLTFAPGETRKDIPVTVLGDILDEDDETFTVTLSEPIGAILGTATGAGTIVDNDSPPGLSLSDVTAQEPNRPVVDPGYFHTDGNQVVDAAGRMIRIAGVNWFGMETPSFAPHGLWARNYRDMMDQMVSLGFNTIRLPFCNQLFDAGSQPNGIDYNLNPDLQGLNGLGILDKVVDYAGQIGLRIILDNHRSDAGGGPNGSGLWYTPQYPESRWIADWTMLAGRYANNPTVIGADLINEPHGPANWGNGDANDWRLAAERAGNAILTVNSNWLIFVEGVEGTSTGYTWWGGNLSNAGAFPVRLNIPGKLVYSPHDYPASVFPQPWFGDPNYPNNLYGIWDKFWGYLYRQGTAPVLIGEFGTRLQTTSDQLWLQTITKYLAGDLNGDGNSDLLPGQQGPSWLWWSWNPNSGDTGGILKDDWVSVNQDKVDALIPIEFPWAGGGNATQFAVFTVRLSAPSGRTIQVNYATADGSATAGLDYKAASGMLTFAPGETSKTVSISILADDITEPAENFYLRLSSPTNATIDDSEGEGTIRDASDAPPPTISIGNAQVTEGDVGTIPLSFTVTLSAPSTQTVTVNYQTRDGSAVAGNDYVFASGTLTFLPGVTSQAITILIAGDTLPEATEVFRVLLSNPANATIANDQGTGTIVDNDTGFPGIRVDYRDRDDWGAGFVADMSIFNDRSDPINGWTLEFDFDRNISNIWNAVIVSHVGTHYVIRNASWNTVIPANGHVDFGFQGDPGNAQAGPSNYIFNGFPLP